MFEFSLSFFFSNIGKFLFFLFLKYLVFSVGSGNMPCQLMMGFFAYAKTFNIHVDKAELEGNYYSQYAMLNFINYKTGLYFPSLLSRCSLA